jgi:competence CoiA-like predicted nuclease
MPLRAYINYEEIISIDQDEKQWIHLKKLLKSKEAILTLPCCKQEGFLRISSKGLKHFVHAKSNTNCDWKPESPEHLRAKIEIIEACKANGWKAIPEFSENNWRADVLAFRNHNRIAFEVQWSKQTFEETKFRQDRYKESSVRGCWFFRTAPKELIKYDDNLLANKDIPAFKIFKDENSNITAQLNEKQLPLKLLVDNLLKRKLKFCEHKSLKSRQEVTIVFFPTICWKCKKPQHIWTVDSNLVTVCTQNIIVKESLWDSDHLDKSPYVIDAIKHFLKTEKGKNLKIGELKKRYSKTKDNIYLSHGCFFCDAISGDAFLYGEKREGKNHPNSIKYLVEIEIVSKKEKGPHWCFSENGQFCE